MMAMLGGIALAACGNAVTTTADVGGRCLRSVPALSGPAIDCRSDAACPCGSYCHLVERVCKVDCWLPPRQACPGARAAAP
jgi:hypothetical protein